MPLLLRDVACSTPDAMSRLIDQYGGLVYGLAVRYLGSARSEVDDAVQDIFVNLWLSASSYNPALGSEAAFIATVARRRLIDRRRRQHAGRASGALPSGLASTVADSPSAEDCARLGEEFANLPEDERTALWMAILKGHTHREIATATNCPVGTVKSRLRRAIMRLRESMGVKPEGVQV